MDLEEWVKKYIQIDMIFLWFFNDIGYWIFFYDDEIIMLDQMLEQVCNDEEVISVEFNKKIYDNLEEEKEVEESVIIKEVVFVFDVGI